MESITKDVITTISAYSSVKNPKIVNKLLGALAALYVAPPAVGEVGALK